MEPATSTRNAIVAALAVAAFSFVLYSRPYFIIGLLAGVLIGAATYWVLRAREVQHVRRSILIFFSTVVWAGFFAILSWIGWLSLTQWGSDHLRVYYFQGAPM